MVFCSAGNTVSIDGKECEIHGNIQATRIKCYTGESRGRSVLSDVIVKTATGNALAVSGQWAGCPQGLGVGNRLQEGGSLGWWIQGSFGNIGNKLPADAEKLPFVNPVPLCQIQIRCSVTTPPVRRLLDARPEKRQDNIQFTVQNRTKPHADFLVDNECEFTCTHSHFTS